MKNSTQIKTAHQLFKNGDLEACKILLKRISNNFEIDNDEYDFSIRCELYQGSKETAEKLISEGKSDWVGDANYVSNQEYLKWSIRTRVVVRSVYPYDTIKFDELGDDGQDELMDLFYHGSCSLDENGICSATGNGGAMCLHMRKETKRIVEKWLKQEFGAVDYEHD